jgi:hypothetical protein
MTHAFDVEKISIIFWTYSTNTLHWINFSFGNLKKIVFNRVGEIYTHNNPSKWKHAPTEINLADIPTRLSKILDLA